MDHHPVRTEGFEPNFGPTDRYAITAIFWEITGIFMFAFVMYGSIAIWVAMG